MPRGNFNHIDVANIIAAAAKNNAVVEFDFKRLVVTVLPAGANHFNPCPPPIDAVDDSILTPPAPKKKPRKMPYNEEQRLLKEMGQEAYDARITKLYDDWADALPRQPLGKLEIQALGQLAAYGVDVPVSVKKLPRLRASTVEKLDLRGHVDFDDSDATVQEDAIWITAAGMEAWRKHEAGEPQPAKSTKAKGRPRLTFMSKWVDDPRD